MLATLALVVTLLPSYVSNGRFFYTPEVRGVRVRIWLDTDGDGFIASDTARRLHLEVAGRRARFPSNSGFVSPIASSGFLSLFDSDRSDRIFDGVDAQFGTTWFQGRVTRFDYRANTLALLDGVAPSAGRLGRAALSAPNTVTVAVEGEDVHMSLDTAATVVLNGPATARMHDAWGSVRATSFLRTDVMSHWHAAHPQWPYVPAAGDGVSLLCVPKLKVGSYLAKNVWFSTRPGDDVFEGESVTGKIGPTAFYHAILTIDYPGGTVYFD